MGKRVIVHYTGPNSRFEKGWAICGGQGSYPLPWVNRTSDPAATTCKRCIASLRVDGLLPREVLRG